MILIKSSLRIQTGPFPKQNLCKCRCMSLVPSLNIHPDREKSGMRQWGQISTIGDSFSLTIPLDSIFDFHPSWEIWVHTWERNRWSLPSRPLVRFLCDLMTASHSILMPHLVHDCGMSRLDSSQLCFNLQFDRLLHFGDFFSFSSEANSYHIIIPLFSIIFSFLSIFSLFLR